MCGGLLGLLAATKERFILVMGAAFVSLFVVLRRKALNLRIYGALALTTLVVVALVYHDTAAPYDLISGLFAWKSRAFSDATQTQPGWFHLDLLSLTSPLVIVALCSIFSQEPFGRYLALQGTLLLLFYSLLPYKTPWLMVSVIPTLYLLYRNTLVLADPILPPRSAGRYCLCGNSCRPTDCEI
jgi:hypothetical protein